MAPKRTEDSSKPSVESEATEPVVGKGRPTPSRKAAQAANAQPLVGSRDKASMKAARQRQMAERDRARLGMMNGEERYLTARDRGPQRRYVRDYVDARFSMGEILIPLMLLMLLGTFLPGMAGVYSVFVVWGFVALAVLDSVLLGVRLNTKLAAKFGKDNVQKGFRWYAAMRAFQMRFLRMPKPQVKRRQYPS